MAATHNYFLKTKQELPFHITMHLSYIHTGYPHTDHAQNPKSLKDHHSLHSMYSFPHFSLDLNYHVKM